MHHDHQTLQHRPVWVGAVIAAVIIIGASFLGFHAFNARAHANAELQSGAQSPQSDNTAQSCSQSGDTPQSTEPTSVNVPKPTPPPHLYAGGQIGAKQHHSGISTCGHMRSIPETQTTS